MARKKYTLVGVDGNAFAVMGYVTKIMTREGFSDQEIDEYNRDAQSDDYAHLIAVSVEMVEKCNNKGK